MRPARDWSYPAWRGALLAAAVAWSSAACGRGDGSRALWRRAPSEPDSAPQMLNAEAPFLYPAALYAQKVQGNVTLRLFVDERGVVHPDSTSVRESSGYDALDSAAMIGSRELRFAPARDGGKPVAVSILFPVYFRHPQGLPLTGDTVLRGRAPRPAPAPPR